MAYDKIIYWIQSLKTNNYPNSLNTTCLGLLSVFKNKLTSRNNDSYSYIYDLSAIALLLLPLTLSNALAMLLGHTFNVLELPFFSKLCFHLSNLLINIYPLSFCIISGYYLSHKTTFNSALFIIYSLVLFYLISIENGSLSTAYYLPNNPLIALLSALVTFIYCTRFNLLQLEPQALDFSSRLFKHMLHFFVFIGSALFLSKVVVKVIEYFTSLISGLSLDPLTFSGGLIYQTLLGLLGAIGINGHNMLFSTKQTIYSATQENMTAWATGETPLNIISQGFYDAFMSMGGSGNSISLLLCVLIFSKERNHIMLALAALPLVIFNINEVLLFGLPIIFNPLLIIPFVGLPLVSFLITYLCISSGLVSPVVEIVNWMTPPLFSGYIAMGNNIEGTLLQLFIIIIGIFIYRPFYLSFAGKYSIRLKSVMSETLVEKSIFTNLLDSVRTSASNSLNKSSAQKRLATLLHEGELLMHYQLLQSVLDKHSFSFEALLRYQDKTGKLHPPTFICDFQLLNMMPMLDNLVIDKVLLDMQQMTLSPLHRVAINISVASIEKTDFVSHLLARLSHFSIPPQWLELEITEEAILSDNLPLLQTMENLKSHGLKISMDDFGTGYASFPHLNKYPFDKIKLDRSLLQDTVTPKGKELYQLIAKMGEIADCEVVAEGVETTEEYEFVAKCGVDAVQGYLLAKPQPLSATLKLIGQYQRIS